MSIMEGISISGVLESGTAEIVNMYAKPLPATIWTLPVAGDTVTVSYSVDNGVSYNTWPNGAVTAFSKDMLVSGITHLKFQRTAGSGTTSTYGVC